MTRHRRQVRWKNTHDLRNLQRVTEIAERMAHTTMRKIEFPPGTRASTRPRISAVAWATNRRGRVAWKSNNVTTQICEYLAENGYVLSTQDVAHVIRWAVEHKYAYSRKHEGGKRTLEFGFLTDIDLTGHDPYGLPKIGEAAGSQATKATIEATTAAMNGSAPATATTVLDKPTTHIEHVPAELIEGTVTPTPPTPPIDIDIPLPGAPEHLPIYREGELMDLLRKWADINPDNYASWVDRSIVQLTAVLNT